MMAMQRGEAATASNVTIAKCQHGLTLGTSQEIQSNRSESNELHRNPTF
jgi:hypothetical protein